MASRFQQVKVNPATKTDFHWGERRGRPRGRTRLKSKKARRGRENRGGHANAYLEQPVADLAGAIQCQICGHPVDPKRMHFHMVRVHGAAFRDQRDS